MKSDYKVFLVVLSVVLLTGCGGGGETDTTTGNETRTTANIFAYEGTWLGHCFDNGNKSSQTTLIIDSGSKTGSYIVKQHDGSFCGTVEDVITKVDVLMVYPSVHFSSVCTNTSQVNFKIKPPIVITDNTIRGVPTNFTTEEFEATIADSGQTLDLYLKLFDIVCSSEDGLSLYVGKSDVLSDGSTSSKRPNELSIQFPLTRQ